ncbi:hypothetical protein O181_091212 [Austropuccinia psidii MF-1]|uniref:Cyanovirin-N domain-containing protein n=1 Tax=Austropuccinia psidii MF-1 TaxID=1389203 RepID=A0A9Q3P8F1_9BASI|nr:hypothetical protein [Austropuccinia psidii MF-1]
MFIETRLAGLAAIMLSLLALFENPAMCRLQKRQQSQPSCGRYDTGLQIHDCNVALNQYAYEGDNKMIRSDLKSVTMEYETCQIIIECDGPVNLTGGRVLNDNHQGGGYQAIADQCKANGGSITVTGGCKIRVSRRTD